MDYSTLLYDVRDGIARITLNRPEAANSMNMEFVREFMDVALRCDDDSSVRAVLVTGAGRMFCAGGDVKGFGGQGDALPRYVKELTTYLHAAISRFARLRAPTIAAVNGVAAGAGMALVCACDLAVVAESSRFLMAYTSIGFIPDGSGTYFLPRIVGLRRAIELVLTNRTLSSAEALDWGIANRVVPDADLLSEAEALAARLAAGPTLALGASKQLLHRSWTETLETQMENESSTVAGLARTADTREGIAAFIEKRTPTFQAR